MNKGAIKGREDFLASLSDRLNRPAPAAVERPVWRSQPQKEVLRGFSQEALVEVLRKQCEVIHTDFYQVPAAALNSKVLELIEKEAAERIIMTKDNRFDSLGLTSVQGEGLNVHVWDPNIGHENIQAANAADIGITVSDITLAESGTVVLFNDKDKGRSVNLLPKTYLAIIPKSTIVPRMTQAGRLIHEKVKKGGSLASCIDFITGPSNSADIELNLVVGVHGPIRAAYIVVEDR